MRVPDPAAGGNGTLTGLVGFPGRYGKGDGAESGEAGRIFHGANNVTAGAGGKSPSTIFSITSISKLFLRENQ